MAYALLALASNTYADASTDTGAKRKTTSVTATHATPRNIDYTLAALGSVESLNAPTIAAETSGRIVRLDVEVGANVLAAQSLALIDNSLHELQAAQAKAELTSQDIQLTNQRRVVERLIKLSNSKSVSRNRLEDEEDKLLMLQAQKEVAQKRFEHARQRESYTTVLAPITGSIAKRYLSLGDYVTPGQPLFDLVAVSRLRARLSFPERDATRIRIGQEVKLQSPAAEHSPAIGQVTQISPRINTTNRALEVLVEFDNPGNWFPGSSVDAQLIVNQRVGALTVSPLSLEKRNGRDVVFVIENEQVSARTVTVGWAGDNWVEITNGISGEDRIVVAGATSLSDGSYVRENAAQP